MQLIEKTTIISSYILRALRSFPNLFLHLSLPPSIFCRIHTLKNNGNMRFTPAIVASFAATVAAHGDHGHDQEPLAGPHEGLWYNTLPGDGGTQVCASNSRDDALKQLTDLTSGRLHLLWHFYIRSSPLPPVSV